MAGGRFVWGSADVCGGGGGVVCVRGVCVGRAGGGEVGGAQPEAAED